MRKLLLFALSLLGLFDSLYLLWAYTSSSRPMVCVGGGCDVVRASSYAHFFGYPTPAYGVAMYGALAILAFIYPFLSGGLAGAARGLLAFIAAAGFLVSAYLTGVEGLVLHAWCAWCLVSAITITLILALAILEAFKTPRAAERPRLKPILGNNLALLLAAFAVGIPSFVYLTRSDAAPPPPTPPPAAKIAAHLVRPDTHFFGNPDARLTVVEFGDFECPYCGEEEKTAKEIRVKYADRVRFAFRQFPLNSVHPYAEKAAEASECAAQQGKFWQAVDFLFKHQTDLTVSALHKYAADLGLDQVKFNYCLDSGEAAGIVKRDEQDGKDLNVDRIPTFFIGHEMVSGVMSFDRFSSLIDQQLAELGPPSQPEAAASKPKPASEAKALPPKKAQATASSPAPPPESASMLGQSSSNVFTKISGGETGCSADEAKMKQPTLIGTSEAHKLFAQGSQTLFVDVRKSAEFRTDHIAGAKDVPIDQFEQEAKKLPRDKTIVLYESGHATGDICAASRAAGRILLSEGFPSDQVKVYQEGLAGWQKAGLPLRR